MAKANKEGSPATGGIESRISVTLNSKHDNSPDLYDIKVGGRRVAYIIDEAPFPVTLLPAETVKLRLTPDEVKVVVTEARKVIAEIVEQNAAATSDIERLLAGA